MSGVKKSDKHRQITRRDFVAGGGRAAVAGLAFPTIVPSSALGLDGTVPPSRRIAIACIGVGARGLSNLQSLLEKPEAWVVAVCDVDTKHAQEAKTVVDRRYAESGGGARGGG